VVGVKRTSPFKITHPVRRERYLNACIFGEYGSGKTFLAASADDVPEMKNVLFIDVESGDLTLQSRPQLDVIQINTYSQLAKIYEFLKLHCQARDEGDIAKLRQLDQTVCDEDRDPPQYRCVVIDSLSEVFRVCMYQLLGIKLGKQALDVEPDQPGYENWSKVTEMIRLLVRSFRDLNMHVIFVCSEKVSDEKGKKAAIGLNLPKALAAEVPGFLDVVGYLMVNTTGTEKGQMTTERRLCLSPGQAFLAKNRFTGFKDPYISEPSMAKVIQLIKFDA
jgi:hypothetical protein